MLDYRHIDSFTLTSSSSMNPLRINTPSALYQTHAVLQLLLLTRFFTGRGSSRLLAVNSKLT